MLINKSVILSLIFTLVLTGCGGSNDGFGVGNGGATATSTTGDTTGDSNSGDDSSTTDPDVNTTVGSVVASILDSDATLTADGASTTIVRALIKNTDDEPMNGVTVSFAAQLGTLSAATAVTNAQGIADVILTSPTTLGAGNVSVSVSGFTSDPVPVSFVAGAPSSILVSSSAPSLNTGSTSKITAVLRDANNHLVQNQAVSFNVTTNNSGASLESLVATTNVNGEATITYTAGNGTGIDTVTVTSQTAGISATTNLTVNAGSVVVAFVNLSSGSESIVADGTSSTAIRVIVTDAQSNGVEGLTVNFTSSLGTLSDGGTATTNSNGTAQVNLTSATTLGIARVDASVSGFNKTEYVNFVPGQPTSISVSSSLATVNTASTNIISAVVRDANNHLVANESVSFNVTTNNSGSELTNFVATTNVNGEASVEYTAGSSSGTDTITATSQSSGISNTTDVVVTSGSLVVQNVEVTLGAKSIIADGASTVSVRAIIEDQFSKPLEGISVDFATTLGTLSAANATTDSSGVAQVNLTSGTDLGVATVSISTNGFLDSETINLVAGAPATLVMTAAPGSVGVSDSTTINARVSDATGHLIEGETVRFEVTTNNSSGSLGALEAVTNVNGVASVTYTGGLNAGTDTITAVSNTIGSITNTVNVAVNASTVAVDDVIVFTGTQELTADGVSEVLVRATVQDEFFNSIAGKAVTFTASAGSFSGGTNTAVTNINGEAEVTLVSSTNLGGAIITANSDGVIGTSTIQFVSGAAASVTSSASLTTLNYGAESIITVSVNDAQGHAVAGEKITFSVSTNNSGGSLSALQVSTDVNGRASVSYNAGSTDGNDVVTAQLANGTSTTQALTVSAAAAVLNSLEFNEVNGDRKIIADGASYTLLRAEVLDVESSTVAGVSVTFTTSVGDFNSSASGVSNQVVVTDANGLAEIELYSQTTVDTAQVTAAVGGLNKTLNIEFIPGVAASGNSTVVASPASLPADGTSETTVTVTLADGNGNAVADGTDITLITTAGSIVSDNPIETESGRVEFTLRSATQSGTASLSVKEVNGLTGSVNFGSNSDNEAANVRLSATETGLSVAGVGQDENTTIEISIDEVDGDPIDEDNWNAGANTARVSFVSRPNGGEFLSGVDASGTVVDTTSTGSIDVVTTNGSAQVNLQAGTLPGVVEIQVEALDQSGNPYGNPVRAVLSQVSIASGPAHTLVFAFPVTGGIQNLGDDSSDPYIPGFYRRKGGITVTDRYGNSVPDGTVINLGVIDTVIAKGTAGSTTANDDVLSGAVTLSDGSATAFNTATVVRSGTNRFIEENDRILVFDAQAEDKSRFVSSVAAGSVTAQSDYLNTQAALDYTVGASLLGASIAGVDPDSANGALTVGRAITKDGLAQIRFTYPADVNSINTGYNVDLDTRAQPYQSGDVYLIAQASTSGATVIEDSLGFGAVSPFKVTSQFDDISASSTINIEVEDGGDGVRVPFAPVSVNVKMVKVQTLDLCVTNEATENACTVAGFDWYESGNRCIDLYINDETDCEDVIGNSWTTGLPSQFDVSAYLGESDASLPGRIPTTATHTTRVPVFTDTDGDAANDFYVHGFTNASGEIELKVVVSGGEFVKASDEALITITSGEGKEEVTVRIPQ